MTVAATAAAAHVRLTGCTGARRCRWVAGRNKRFEGVSLAEAQRLLGAKLGPRKPAVAVDLPAGISIPAAFDARTQWPGAIHPVRDQQRCGSCWAFGATEALSDRFAIASAGKINVVLSPQQLVSCDNKDGNMGCMGGYPIRAWQYMQSTGVTTDDCYPYSSGGGATGTCMLKDANCPSGHGTVSMYRTNSSYTLPNNVTAIQSEIMRNGPVEIAFMVYQDFFTYKSGVYQHVTGGLAGGHAVKMFGWGTLNGTDYWLCANSWGEAWGASGYFMIRRGTDECGVESGIVAGTPSL